MKYTIRFMMALFMGPMLLGAQQNAGAHCDTLDGPVIKDAKFALEKKDVTQILKWVKKEREAEIVIAGKSHRLSTGERVLRPGGNPQKMGLMV